MPQLLATGSLQLGLSVWVTECPGVPGEVQVTAATLSDAQLRHDLGLAAHQGGPSQWDALSRAAALPLMMIPARFHLVDERDHRRGGEEAAAGSMAVKVLRDPGQVTAVLGPTPCPSGAWRQLRFKIPVDCGQEAIQYVAVSLRGRARPRADPMAATAALPSYSGPKFALAELR